VVATRALALVQLDGDPGTLPSTTAPLIHKYCNEKAAHAEFKRVKDFWQDLIHRVHIETPEPSLNLLTNIWLKYQAISAHLWAWTGYYQQSGAYGYRDQLQFQQIWLPIDRLEC
jgi:cellobiose phosphorylase